jgi:HK97 family phage major capsid protein
MSATLELQLAKLRNEAEAKNAQAMALLGKDEITDADVAEADKLVSEVEKITGELAKKGSAFERLEKSAKEIAKYVNPNKDAKAAGGPDELGAGGYQSRGNLGVAEAEVNFATKMAAATWGLKPETVALADTYEYAEALTEFFKGKGVSSATASVIEKGRIGQYRDQPEFIAPTFGRKDITIGSDASAGFLADREYIARILEKLPTSAVLYPRCSRIPTQAKGVDVPRSTYVADNRYTSAVRVSWTAEQPAPDPAFPAFGHKAADPVFEQVPLNVGTVMSYIDMSENFFEDAQVGGMVYVNGKLTQGYELDREFQILFGAGTSGTPQGIITLAQSAEAINLFRAASGTANDFGPEDVFALEDSLPAQYEGGASFIGAKTTRSKIRQFTQANNQIFYQTLGTVLDRYLVCDFMPLANDATNKIPLLYGNLVGYTIVERTGNAIRMNPYIRSTANTVRVESRGRYTGKMVEPWWMSHLECLTS